MRRLARLTGLAIALLITLPAMADKASSAYKKGIDAEARQNYEEAYDYFKQAYELKPKDIKYRASFTRIRFYAASSHLHKGQLLKEQGKLEEALAEFQKATEIDPTNFVAAQELRRTKLDIDRRNNPSAEPEESSSPKSNYLSQLAQHAAGPTELRPISNTPITLRMTEDTKNIYTAIGKIAGLNVLFDPDYTSRRIVIELNGVSLNEALEIVALQSKTFWRPVTPNTIFVAADTPAKRKELEQSVIKTFYLGNVSSPNDLQDAVNTVRQILDVQRIQQITTQNAIVVRGTPDQIAMAEKLLGDIDKAKPEVVVEVAVMQVRRDKTRTFGISPPTSASIALQPNTTTSSGTDNTSGSNTNNSINLNKLANLDARDFQVTIPAASFSALLTDSNTRIIQNPQIRALDNQKASLKIGDRVPVATGSFQPGIGGVGINPLVNTQFQYIDVGVNIDITPRIHAGREVTMKLVLEISSVTGKSSIGGIDQPIIGQRRIEHEIRLKEGEVNLLGGILEQGEQTSLTGYPVLTKIPILKYLFGQESKQIQENEIVFALVPHIVRGQDLSDMNQQPVEVGTANAIELRRASPPPTPVAASAPQQGVPAQQQPSPASANVPPAAAPVPAPQGAQPVQTPPPAEAPPPQQQPMPQQRPQTQAEQQTGTLQAGSAVLSFEPAAVNQAVNSTFVVNVSLGNAQNVYSVPSQITYDPKVLQLVNVSNGGFLGKDGQPVALVHRDDPASGTIQITATRPPGSGGVSGQGPVFTLTFMAKAAGQTTLAVTRAGARDPAMQPIPVAGGQAMVTVK
ncbi:MAG TPA: cohesin domain-containing protein [Terriglobales bacterium]|nr:cohesin domain-containing protein [Terriglobales bacterium]